MNFLKLSEIRSLPLAADNGTDISTVEKGEEEETLSLNSAAEIIALTFLECPHRRQKTKDTEDTRHHMYEKPQYFQLIYD